MTTPARAQYLQIKKQYPDAILFFRMGDFYETFDDDAKTASRELDIALTAREMGKGKKIPLAGIPARAVEGYVARLIQRGYKVAVCDQVGDIQSGKIVEREVTRVVTPGTVIEPGMLDETENNYLAAIVTADGFAGLAYVDISTGEFAVMQLEGPDFESRLVHELERLRPTEILVPEPDSIAEPDLLSEPGPLSGWYKALSERPHVTRYDSWRWAVDVAGETLQEHFGVHSLEPYGCQSLPLAISAAGAIVQYLRDTQKSALCELDHLTTVSQSEYMILDVQSRRNLELTESGRNRSKTHSLLGILDCTRTGMGARLLRSWLSQPLLDLRSLEARLHCVSAFVDDGTMRLRFRELLASVSDLERLANRARQGVITPRELAGMRSSLRELPELLGLLNDERLYLLAADIDPCEDVENLLTEAIADDPSAIFGSGEVIRRGFSDQLDELKKMASEGKQWLAQLEMSERERTGVRNLKVAYNKVFGYYIEVSAANLDRVPEDYIRKQTLVNAERFITPELKKYEDLILNAEERLGAVEEVVYSQVVSQVVAEADRLIRTARAIAQADVFSSLAHVAVNNRWVRPALDTGDVIDIRAGRHPVVEAGLSEGSFVANDILLSNDDTQIVLLTGPNMAGKSTYLRQAALIVLLAQIGSYIPADSAHIGLVDRIFTRVGAQDDIATGQSTFLVEMVETANILHHATSKSLVVLDEIGRGTSTYDGLAIAKAVVEHLHNHPSLGTKTLFATHYHELTELEKQLPRVKNYNVSVLEQEDDVVFLHKIVRGGADRSYGIHVAKLAGLPRSVLRRATDILRELESGDGRQKKGAKSPAMQLTLFVPEENPLVKELAEIEVEELSPLEAINELYRLRQKAKEG